MLNVAPVSCEWAEGLIAELNEVLSGRGPTTTH